MSAYIQVHALAPDRTALGIMHAYLQLNPEATLDELKKAFPESLNPDSGQKCIFATLEEILKMPERTDRNSFFTNDDCILKLKDGTDAAVVTAWTEESLKKLAEQAVKYKIEVAPEEKTNKSFCKKRGFYLICTEELKCSAHCDNDTSQRYDEHSLNFLKRIDPFLFVRDLTSSQRHPYGVTPSLLSKDTEEIDLNLIHYNFEQDGDTVTVYADGELTFIGNNMNITDAKAWGVLKGYVENLYQYYVEHNVELSAWGIKTIPKKLAPDCDKSEIERYVKKYMKYMDDVWECADYCDNIYKITDILDTEPKHKFWKEGRHQTREFWEEAYLDQPYQNWGGEDDYYGYSIYCEFWEEYWGSLRAALREYMDRVDAYAEDRGLCNPQVPEDPSGYIVEAQICGAIHLHTKEEYHEVWWTRND